MKNIVAVLAVLLSLLVVSPVFAEEGAKSEEGINSHIKVEVAAIATDIQDRMPIGVAESFSHDIEKLYCYTKITGLDTDDVVQHVWYFKDREMARIDLRIAPPTWRTWSSKRIIRTWKGDWRVDIVVRGQVLESLEFTVDKGH